MFEDYSAVFETDITGDSTGFLFLFWLIYGVFMLVLSILPYVLQSLGFYSIAKRRGIRHPWLSWIPVGSSWILGCISDQYQYVAKGRARNKRKALIVLNIVLWIVYAVFFALFLGVFVMVIAVAMDPSIGEAQMDALFEQMIMEHIGSLLLMAALYFVMMGVAIAVMIIQYICLYDLYSSCEPRNNVLYLVLGIFVSICQPIFIFVCRNKDDGMPPRRPEPAAYVSEPPAEPWEQNPEL